MSDTARKNDTPSMTSIVFGRDERERAVMNYSNGCWYIEDLDSENGTRLQRGGKGKKYKVSSREPCRIEQGDVIYLGLAPVKIQ